MGKWMGWALAVVMAGSGVAHAAGGKNAVDRWGAVEGLAPDARIDVLPQNQAGPDACWLTSVDDAALTCVVGNGTRLVYPRAAVRDVWVIEPTHGWDARTWIKAGFGLAGIGLGVACIVANPMCAVPFGAVALWWLERSTFPGPVGPPRPQRMRRRLVYRSSTP